MQPVRIQPRTTLDPSPLKPNSRNTAQIDTQSGERKNIADRAARFSAKRNARRLPSEGKPYTAPVPKPALIRLGSGHVKKGRGYEGERDEGSEGAGYKVEPRMRLRAALLAPLSPSPPPTHWEGVENTSQREAREKLQSTRAYAAEGIETARDGVGKTRRMPAAAILRVPSLAATERRKKGRDGASCRLIFIIPLLALPERARIELRRFFCILLPDAQAAALFVFVFFFSRAQFDFRLKSKLGSSDALIGTACRTSHGLRFTDRVVLRSVLQFLLLCKLKETKRKQGYGVNRNELKRRAPNNAGQLCRVVCIVWNI